MLIDSLNAGNYPTYVRGSKISISQAEQKFWDPRCLKRESKLLEASVQMVKVA